MDRVAGAGGAGQSSASVSIFQARRRPQPWRKASWNHSRASASVRACASGPSSEPDRAESEVIDEAVDDVPFAAVRAAVGHVGVLRAEPRLRHLLPAGGVERAVGGGAGGRQGVDVVQRVGARALTGSSVASIAVRPRSASPRAVTRESTWSPGTATTVTSARRAASAWLGGLPRAPMLATARRMRALAGCRVGGFRGSRGGPLGPSRWRVPTRRRRCRARRS